MTGHLRGHVRAYVDRALPAPMLRAYDQHLVFCAVCRAMADQERRIVAALRADTGIPQSLRSSLMSLAVVAVPTSTSGVPDVPLAPSRLRMPSGGLPAPVPTVAPTSPPLHRSPARAALVASLAAGASVAAAWGLAVSPLPAGSPLRTPLTRVPDASATMAPATLAPAFVATTRMRASTPWTASGSSAMDATRTWSVRSTAPVSIRLVDSAESGP